MKCSKCLLKFFYDSKNQVYVKCLLVRACNGKGCDDYIEPNEKRKTKRRVRV